MESKNLFVKTLNVINSCITKEQLFTARRYFMLAKAKARLSKENAKALNIRLEMKRFKINASVVERDTHMP